MSRDYHAKRLAEAEGISYTSALRRVRAARAAEQGQFDRAHAEAVARVTASAMEAAELGPLDPERKAELDATAITATYDTTPQPLFLSVGNWRRLFGSVPSATEVETPDGQITRTFEGRSVILYPATFEKEAS